MAFFGLKIRVSAVRFRPKPPNNSIKSSTYSNVGAFFIGKFGKISKITALARATPILDHFLGVCFCFGVFHFLLPKGCA